MGIEGTERTVSGNVRPRPVPLRTIVVVRVGMALWAVVLLVLLVVPGLDDGGRDWWPWVAVSGLVLGALGHAYLARGRGNASDA